MSQLLQILLVLSCSIYGLNGDGAWFDKAIFYQVYPQSFKEGKETQVGTGDLKGVIEKLDYFTELRVDAIWLNPIYKASTHGYDITDFKSIDPKYGTIEDFKKLTEEAGKKNIKIIMDFVPNHVSHEHEWFQKSIKKEGNYTEYFIWNAGKNDTQNPSQKLPPNNWLRIGASQGESAWEMNQERGEFFFFQFAPNMPDLNMRSKFVQDELKDVLKFWLDLGVGGFRIDAISHGFESENLTDEPLKQNGKVGVWDDLDHKYTVDQDETFQIVYDWRKFVDDYQKEKGGEERLIMTESYSEVKRFQQDPKDASKKGAHLPFYFNAIFGITEKSTAKDFKAIYDEAPESTTWVIGNHDQPRTANRVGKERIDLMNIFLLMIGGATVTYYGEEIGMENVCNKYDEATKRYRLCQAGESTDWKDDHSRTPFQWGETKNAGFSSSDVTLFPVSPDYATHNLKLQKSTNSSSHFKVYKKFAELKKSEEFRTAEKMNVTAESEILLKAVVYGKPQLTILFNLNATGEQIVKLEDPGHTFSVRLSSHDDSKYKNYQTLSAEELNALTLKPLEVLVLRSNALKLQSGILSLIFAALLVVFKY